MKKRVDIKFTYILFIFVVLSLGVFSLTSAMGQTNSFGDDNSFVKVDTKVLEKFDAGEERVRVIVQLKDEVEGSEIMRSNKGKVSAQAKEKRQEAIERARIEDKVRHQFIYSNAFSAELTEEEMEELQKDDSVKRIEIVNSQSLFLQESVEIINATSIWNNLIEGENLTGVKQTVCVIDTGVDYNHPDLGSCYGENDPQSNCKVIGGYNTVENNPDPMDNHGHGTHVAGIVGARGEINGTAPNVKIAAINSYDSGAKVFRNDDLIAGIEWCIDNSTLFNISVISMSLGGGSYGNYCDNNFSPLSGEKAIIDLIDEATSKNISVVIATGNANLDSRVAFPSCVENSIRVGSTTKQDLISDHSNWGSNRWALDMLVAPGSSINSTLWLDTGQGNYGSLSGTSMATPHVSGAIAIINQYLQLKNESMTPKEIQAILENSGKTISADDREYSRIDVYSAIKSLEEDIPIVGIYPNNSIIEYGLESINISWFAESRNLDKTRFNITRPNDELLYESDIEEGIIVLNPNNLTGLGTYEINLWANSSKGNESFVSNSFVVQDTISPKINFVEPAYPNNSFLSQNYIEVNTTAFDLNLDTIEIFVYNESNLLLNNSSQESSFFWNATNLEEGVYYFNATANDTVGNENSTETRIVTLDMTSPKIEIIFPENKTYSNATQLFNISANDLNLDSVWYNWNGTNYTYEDPLNITFNQGINTLHAWANDTSGNVNYTNVSFTVDTTPPELKIDLNHTLIEFNNESVRINWTVSDELSEIDLVIFNITYPNESLLFESHDETGELILTPENLTELKNYNVNLWANDTAGNVNYISSSFFVYRIFVELIAPSDGHETTSKTISFKYEVYSSKEIINCSFFIDNEVKEIANNVTKNEENNFSHTFSKIGTPEWFISCEDEEGNVDNSIQRSLILKSPPSSGGGGGGGSNPSSDLDAGTAKSSSAKSTEEKEEEIELDFVIAEEPKTELKTYNLTRNKIVEEYSQKIKAKEKILFEIKAKNETQKHELIMNEIGEDFVNITIRSEEINFLLNIGEERKLNLTSKEYYDFFIKLESIENDEANIILKEIHEAMIEERKMQPKYALIGFVSALILIIILYGIFHKRDEK